MIKTLRITIIITAIVAAIFFILSGLFGLRRDQNKEALLAVPAATIAFKSGSGSRNLSEMDVPLVKQAQTFALRINPPKPKMIESPVAVKPIDEGPKFKLLGTSFLAENPIKSMALIDEPGKGMHWVAASDKVDRFTITQITDGKITYTDGKASMEMIAPKSEIAQQITVVPVIVPATEPQALAAPQAETPTESKAPTAEEIKANAEFIKKLMADPNTSGIGKEEANGLKDLGAFLKQVEQEQAVAEANQPGTGPNDSNKAKISPRRGSK